MTEYKRGEKVFTYWNGEPIMGYVEEVNGNIVVVKSLQHLNGQKLDADEYVMVFSWDQSSLRKPYTSFYEPHYLKTVHPLSMVFAGTLAIFGVIMLI